MKAVLLKPDEAAFDAWLKTRDAQEHIGRHVAFDPKLGTVIASSPQLYGLVAQLKQRSNPDGLLFAAIPDSSIRIVNLSPVESECRVCGKSLLNCQQGIAFFEDEPVPHAWTGDWAGFDACVRCFLEYEMVQDDPQRLTEWYTQKRGQVRNPSQF